ncbi:RidA family protein [Noviherbaspirillum galbum]|uniref:RidA family protein n=1 Tax=Noviherbaspirillum galbum TaxID=2709383 RepID=A0A6B3SYX2_9BURK|nr:RidA family protein [Noviherbaspirillum galbum]NEX64112.1 RidA family protein [Noviherbaspirillum galbum]
MPLSREALFQQAAAELGYGFDGEIRIGGNYASVIIHGDEAYVSGQIPRVGDEVVVTGRVGVDVTLDDARRAAKVCAMRALAVLRQACGSLDAVRQVLRITVFVQSGMDFTRQSEVADGASDLLRAVLGDAGAHSRTSVGVFTLPKNASVEIDLIAAIHPHLDPSRT